MRAAFISTFIFVCLIYFFSGFGKTLDPALFNYLTVSTIAFFCVSLRLFSWFQRPATKMYLSGYDATSVKRMLSCGYHKLLYQLTQFVTTRFVVQNQIRKRNYIRWAYHIMLSGGCTLAFIITFPLVFGFIIFDGSDDAGHSYKLLMFGVTMAKFPIDSFIGWTLFNGLNISAILAISGTCMAMYHRAFDKGLKSTSRFTEDWIPLLVILSVSLTGILLWVSAHYMEGYGHKLLRYVHFVTVAFLILYIPFGKLFHIFQRWLSVLVKFHQYTGNLNQQRECIACGYQFNYQLHCNGLSSTLDSLGFNYNFSDKHNQSNDEFCSICPKCRRTKLAMVQGRTLGR